jgi:hypothetical protein
MTGKRRGKRVVAADGTVTIRGKNANGEGSVYRGADGRWVATWWEPGGKYPRKATGVSRDAAMRRRTERRSQQQVAAGQTFSEVADWWLENVYSTSVSIDTWHKAEERLPRIKRAFGHLRPDEVTYDGVSEWIAELAREFSRGTVKNYRQTLALIVDDAVRRRLAPGNPVRTTKLPAMAQAEGRALDSAEAKALVAAKALDALESWLVRRILVRATTSSYTQIAAEIVTELRKAERADAGDVVEGFLARQTVISRYWPDDEEVTTELESLQTYLRLRRGRLRMILEAVEDHLRGWIGPATGLGSERVARGWYHIEHVMPRSWQANWPLDPGTSEAERDQLIHTLGNLTLLTSSLNSRVSNAPWTTKRDASREHDVLLLTRNLVTHAGDEWT